MLWREVRGAQVSMRGSNSSRADCRIVLGRAANFHNHAFIPSIVQANSLSIDSG